VADGQPQRNRAFEHCIRTTILEAAMTAKRRAQEGGSRKKNKKGLGKKERHEPNLGQVEAREEKEKASDVAHMGEMPDQSQPKRR
jgi:hypothetical protein